MAWSRTEGGGRLNKTLLWDSGNQYCESLDDITRAGALWLFLGFLALMLRRTRLQLLLALERSPASATKIPFVLGGLGQGFVKSGLLQNPKSECIGRRHWTSTFYARKLGDTC